MLPYSLCCKNNLQYDTQQNTTCIPWNTVFSATIFVFCEKNDRLGLWLADTFSDFSSALSEWNLTKVANCTQVHLFKGILSLLLLSVSVGWVNVRLSVPVLFQQHGSVCPGRIAIWKKKFAQHCGCKIFFRPIKYSEANRIWHRLLCLHYIFSSLEQMSRVFLSYPRCWCICVRLHRNFNIAHNFRTIIGSWIHMSHVFFLSRTRCRYLNFWLRDLDLGPSFPKL